MSQAKAVLWHMANGTEATCSSDKVLSPCQQSQSTHRSGRTKRQWWHMESAEHRTTACCWSRRSTFVATHWLTLGTTSLRMGAKWPVWGLHPVSLNQRDVEESVPLLSMLSSISAAVTCYPPLPMLTGKLKHVPQKHHIRHLLTPPRHLTLSASSIVD